MRNDRQTVKSARTGRWMRRAVAAAVLFAAGATQAAVVPVTWTGGAAGNWSVLGNWSPGVVPHNAADTYNVSIDGGNAINAVVAVDGSFTISTLVVDSGDRVNINVGQVFSIVGATTTNNGMIVINTNQANATTQFVFTSAMVSGTGSIVLNGNGNLNTAQLNGSLTQSAGHTISGQGQIQAVLTNNGTVNATGSLQLLSSNMTNNSLFEATAGGTLTISGITVTQGASGQILADNGTVNLSGNTTIIGGTLNTANGGTINNSGGTNTLNGVTNNGAYRIAVGTQTHIDNNLANAGTITININQGNATTALQFNGGTVSGAGSIAMNGNSNLNTAQINGSLAQSAGHTISGQGQINAALTNNGVVNSNLSGGNLTLQTSNMTNNSLFEATAGGTLTISGITVTQGASGQTLADNGTVNLSGNTTIIGGTLNTANGGTINNTGGTSTLNGVTNNGAYRIAVGTQTHIDNNLANAGTITININQGNATTALQFNGGTLSGAGSILLNGNGNLNTAQINGSLTQSAGHTISGQGQINAVFTNNGVVNSNLSGGNLTLQTGNMTNNNLFEATAPAAQANVGTLNISGIVVTQGASGQILADGISGANRSTVNIGGNATISGGTLTTSNSGIIVNSSGTNTLTNVTMNADFRLLANTFTIINGNLPGTGTITVNTTQGNATTTVTFNGGTISGAGSIVLNGNGNLNTAQIAGTLTQAAGHTISGQGQVLAALTNHGTVNANNGIIELIGATGSNDSLMTATNGTLRFSNGIALTNTGGTISANGGNVVFEGAASITNGSLTSTGANVLTSSNASFADVTLTTGSKLTITAATTATASGTLTNQGTVTVNTTQGNAGTNLAFSGAAILAGGGEVVLNGNGNLNTAQVTTNALATLTQNASSTIRGQGQILAVLTNNGTVNATGSLQLLSNPMTNNNVFKATTGTLIISGITVTQGVSGQILADGGAVNLTGATVISGGTLNSTNGGTINNTGGNNTLASVTNNSDFRQVANTQTTVTGNLLNNGSFLINTTQGNAGTNMDFSGGTLSGTGFVDLNANGNLNTAQLTGTLTQAAGHSIIGHGQINAVLTNQGLVHANTAGTILQITAANSNSGTYQASNGGTLNVTGDLAQDDVATAGTLTGGTYVVLAGSAINVPAPGQALSTIGSAAKVVLSGAGSTFTSGGVSVVTSLNTNNGELHVLNRTYGAPAFTNAASGLLQLGGFAALPTGGATFTAPSLANNGKIQATGAGNVLTVAAGFQGTGTLQIDAGAALNISAGGSSNTVGTLKQDGSLNLGTTHITVSSSYTNANFGVGDGFNKHAGVTPATATGNSGAIVTNGANTITVTGGPIAFGNVHVGSNNTINYTINNNGSNGPAVLFAIQPTTNGGNITDASLSGAGVTSSNVGPVNIGSNSGPLAVNWAPTAGGPLAGQAVHIANNFDDLAESTLNVTGTAYHLAQANTISPSTVVLPNIHVGGSFAMTPISISNTGPAGAFTEGLDAAPGTPTGAASAVGSVSNLTVAGSPATPISVGLGNANTSTPGLKSGTVPVNFTSNGTGTSGLAPTALAGQTVTVQGTVWAYADATVGNVVFGTHHVGDVVPSQAISITNSAAAGVSEKLNATLGAITGSAFSVDPASVAINLLAPGATDSTSFLIKLDTSNVGVFTETATIHLVSDGAGTSGLGQTALADKTSTLSATVTNVVSIYRLASASAHTPEPVTFPNKHVGDVNNTMALTIGNNAINDGFSEKLDATFGGPSNGTVTATGSFSLLAPGQSDTTNLVAGIDTSSAGHKAGTGTITLTSNGEGTSGLGFTSIGTQTVNISGDVYRLADPSASPSPVGGGARHKGDPAVTQNFTFKNDADDDGFSENLVVSTNPLSGPASYTGTSPITVAPQGQNSTIGISIPTTTSGHITGSVSFHYVSDGAGSSGLGQTDLGNQTINYSMDVFEYAAPAFSKTAGSGTLVPDGTGSATYTLTFPTVTEPASDSATLSLANLLIAANPAFQDGLAGTFSFLSGEGTFQLSGFGDIDVGSAIAAGDSLGNFMISYIGLTAGTYDESILFTPISTNNTLGDVGVPSLPNGITLNIHLVVNPVGSEVPEPASLGVLALGAAGLLLRRRK